MFHIEGVTNELADILSRTVHRNLFVLSPAWVQRTLPPLDFDLFGSATHSLARHFPRLPPFCARPPSLCPPVGVSVLSPRWKDILALCTAVQSAPVRAHQALLIILPFWPAQLWWPLARRLGPLFLLPGYPWLNPAAPRTAQPRWRAVVCLRAGPSAS